MKTIVLHGEKRLREEINRFCRKCSERPMRGGCHIKNQRACKDVQQEFEDKIRGVQKDEYICHRQIIQVEA